MPVSTGSFSKDLLPQVSQWVGTDYAALDTCFDKMFEIVKSDRSFEEDVLDSGLGLAQVKGEGSKINYDAMSQGYTKRYTHIVYANGFVVTREALEDGQSGIIARGRSKKLAWSMRQTKEIVAANVYNRAFNSSFTGGDTKELCATDHPTKDADLRNELSTAADLSEASLEQSLIDLGDFRDDRGLRIKAQAMKLIIPKELEFEAHRILNSNLRPGVADNDANAIKDMNKFPGGVVMCNYLDDTDAFFIVTDVPDGMKMYERRGLEMSVDNDFDTENAKFKATMRFAVGWTDPRGIFGSPGAA